MHKKIDRGNLIPRFFLFFFQSFFEKTIDFLKIIVYNKSTIKIMKEVSTMTKQEADKIKKIVTKETGIKYTVYFNSQYGELRFTVAQWYDNSKSDHSATAAENIIKILNALTKYNLRPKYHKEIKRYQGFINRQYIVFE